MQKWPYVQKWNLVKKWPFVQKWPSCKSVFVQKWPFVQIWPLSFELVCYTYLENTNSNLCQNLFPSLPSCHTKPPSGQWWHDRFKGAKSSKGGSIDHNLKTKLDISELLMKSKKNCFLDVFKGIFRVVLFKGAITFKYYLKGVIKKKVYETLHKILKTTIFF